MHLKRWYALWYNEWISLSSKILRLFYEMDSNTSMNSLHKLLTGFRLRCPNCERGRLFPGRFNLFRMEKICPECGVRFERSDGEGIGGMFINLGLAEILAFAGFFTTEAVFHPPLLTQILVWGGFNVIFCLLFYRHARGLWVGVLYLTGSVYTDAEKP